MSRYGYDYNFENNRNRAMMRGYDGDQRFIANDLSSWNARPYDGPSQGFQGRPMEQGRYDQSRPMDHGRFDQGRFNQGRPNEQFGRGYDRPFHAGDSIPRRMGGSYGGGYDRQQGFYRPSQQQGFVNRGYDRNSGYDFNAGYGGQQGSNWQEIYRQVDRPRSGGMTSPWESHIPGAGMRPSFPYGMTRGGGWF